MSQLRKAMLANKTKYLADMAMFNKKGKGSGAKNDEEDIHDEQVDDEELHSKPENNKSVTLSNTEGELEELDEFVHTYSENETSDDDNDDEKEEKHYEDDEEKKNEEDDESQDDDNDDDEDDDNQDDYDQKKLKRR